MITHHDNQKIDGNELFMIEDVPTHEYDDDTENPKASSVGKASTNVKETQLDRRGLDRQTNSATTASHERNHSVGEMNLETSSLWSNGTASSEHLLRSECGESDARQIQRHRQRDAEGWQEKIF